MFWYLFGEIADKIVCWPLFFYNSNTPISQKSSYINLESGAEGLSLNQHLQPILKGINALESEPA